MEFEGSSILFENFGTGMRWVLWLSFGLAFIMGAVANKTNFCTMGAVSDYINIGDTGRWRAWLFAMVVAIIGVILLEKFKVFGLDTNLPKPNYRMSNFQIGNYIVGGLLFGVGMTFGSGCGNKTLVRIGGGNIKSIFVLLIMGIFAYWMILGFNGKSLIGVHPFTWAGSDWGPFEALGRLSFPMRHAQDIGAITEAASKATTLTSLDWYGFGLSVVVLLFVIFTGNIINRPEKILALVLSLTIIVGVGLSFTSVSVSAVNIRLYAGAALSLLLLIYILKSKHFTGSFDNILGGLVVGLCVVGMWYVNSATNVKAFDPDDATSFEKMSLPKFYSEWDSGFVATSYSPARETVKNQESTKKVSIINFVRPDVGIRHVGPQGMTFVNPTAWMWNMILGSTLGKKDSSGKNLPIAAFLNVPMMILFGIIAGSFIWALLSRSFRFEWFASFKDFFSHSVGAVMMGVGGVLALGCTIGQGVTGVSTLALGSFVVLVSIYMGAALSMKIQLYKMVYEEAGFGTILVTSLADMKLLPKSMKKLESI